ncbi:hypothetical protein MBLNU457_g2860t3 [Dothideomycetes sp. NU457]
MADQYAAQSAPSTGAVTARQEASRAVTSAVAQIGEGLDQVESLIIRFKNGSLVEITNAHLLAARPAEPNAQSSAPVAAPVAASSSGLTTDPSSASADAPSSAADLASDAAAEESREDPPSERAASPEPEGPSDGDWIVASDFGFDERYIWSGGFWTELHCESGKVAGILSAKRPIKGDVRDCGVKWTPCGKAAIPIDVALSADIFFSEDTQFPGYRLELRDVRVGQSQAFENVRFVVGRPGNWEGLCRVAHEIERVRLCGLGEINPEEDEMSAEEMAELREPKKRRYGKYKRGW